MVHEYISRGTSFMAHNEELLQAHVGWQSAEKQEDIAIKEWSSHMPVRKAQHTFTRRVPTVSQKWGDITFFEPIHHLSPRYLRPIWKQKSAQHSSITWFLLSCLTARVICSAINNGIFCTTKAGIRSPQFSFVPVNKSTFFYFFWMQPPIASTIVSQTCSRTIISILYYTDQPIPGYVKFFMINVSSFQHSYYNCINILCFFFYPSTQIYKVCSVISFSLQSKCSNIWKQTARWLIILSFSLFAWISRPSLTFFTLEIALHFSEVLNTLTVFQHHVFTQF